MEPSRTPLIPVTVPTMTIDRFSELSGLDEGVIQGHIRRGYLPTVKMGRYRMINVALLTARCLSTEEIQ